MEKKSIDEIIKYILSDDIERDAIRKNVAKSALNSLYKAEIINKSDELLKEIIQKAEDDNCFNIDALNDLLSYIDIKEDVQKYGKDIVKNVITLLHNNIINYHKTIINERIKLTKDLYKELDETNCNINKEDIMIKIIKELLE